MGSAWLLQTQPQKEIPLRQVHVHRGALDPPLGCREPVAAKRSERPIFVPPKKTRWASERLFSPSVAAEATSPCQVARPKVNWMPGFMAFERKCKCFRDAWFVRWPQQRRVASRRPPASPPPQEPGLGASGRFDLTLVVMMVAETWAETLDSVWARVPLGAAWVSLTAVSGSRRWAIQFFPRHPFFLGD